MTPERCTLSDSMSSVVFERERQTERERETDRERERERDREREEEVRERRKKERSRSSEVIEQPSFLLLGAPTEEALSFPRRSSARIDPKTIRAHRAHREESTRVIERSKQGQKAHARHGRKEKSRLSLCSQRRHHHPTRFFLRPCFFCCCKRPPFATQLAAEKITESTQFASPCALSKFPDASKLKEQGNRERNAFNPRILSLPHTRKLDFIAATPLQIAKCLISPNRASVSLKSLIPGLIPTFPMCGTVKTTNWPLYEGSVRISW